MSYLGATMAMASPCRVVEEPRCHRNANSASSPRRQHGVFTLAASRSQPASPGRRCAVASSDGCGRRSCRGCTASPRSQADRLAPATDGAHAASTGGVSAGRAAGALHGLAGAPPADPRSSSFAAPRHRYARGGPHQSIDCRSGRPAPTSTASRATTPARTLIDLGGRLPRPPFEDVLDTAIVRRTRDRRSAPRPCRRALGAAPERVRGRPRAARRLVTRACTGGERVGSQGAARSCASSGCPSPRSTTACGSVGACGTSTSRGPRPRSRSSSTASCRTRRGACSTTIVRVRTISSPTAGPSSASPRRCSRDPERTFAPIAAAIVGKR